jgi:hypothetical protein
MPDASATTAVLLVSVVKCVFRKPAAPPRVAVMAAAVMSNFALLVLPLRFAGLLFVLFDMMNLTRDKG